MQLSILIFAKLEKGLQIFAAFSGRRFRPKPLRFRLNPQGVADLK